MLSKTNNNHKSISLLLNERQRSPRGSFAHNKSGNFERSKKAKSTQQPQVKSSTSSIEINSISGNRKKKVKKINLH